MAYIDYVMVFCITLHFLLLPITICGQTSRLEYIGMAVFISFIGMMLQVFMLIVCADANYHTTSI